MFFCNQNRERLVKNTATPGSLAESGKILGQQWAKVSEKEKAKYTALAEKDRARYDKEMLSYAALGHRHVEHGYQHGAKVSTVTADGSSPVKRRVHPPQGRHAAQIKARESGKIPRGGVAKKKKELSENIHKQISSTVAGAAQNMPIAKRMFNTGVHILEPIMPDARKKHRCKRCLIVHKKRRNPHMTCTYCKCALCLNCWALWHAGK
jgi:hypothetical protein